MTAAEGKKRKVLIVFLNLFPINSIAAETSKLSKPSPMILTRM